MIAIVDYKGAKTERLCSLLTEAGIKFKLTDSESGLCSARRLILPDAEDLSTALKYIYKLNIFNILKILNKPVLGISAGMHMMCGLLPGIQMPGLSLLPAGVIKTEKGEEITGFRNIHMLRLSRLLSGPGDNVSFYFSSDCAVPVNEFSTAAIDRDGIYCAVMERDNFFGVQFLPEESGDPGLQILRNFSEI